jgi:rhamnose transport system permease protein
MKSPLKSILLRHETVLLLILAAEWWFFSAAGHNFSTLDNTFDILRHSAEIGLLALAMTAVILTGGIDLSVGSLLGLCAVLFGTFWRDAHLSIWVAMVFTLLAGALAGGFNAALITWLRLPPLIVTLATFSLFRGLAEAITHGVDTFTHFPEAFLFLGQERWLGLPAQLPIFFLFAAGI